MALTYLQLLTDLASTEGKVWDATAAGGTSDAVSPSVQYLYVQHVNEALRWVWEDHDPEFCWPYSEVVADDATVAVSGGLISLSDLTDSGDARWCSLWTSDPRTYQSTGRPLMAQRSNDGVHVISESVTNCFAFYRKTCPQGSWDTDYSTPSTIPAQLRQAISLKAAALRLASMGQFEEAAQRESAAEDWLSRRKRALLHGTLPWQDHYLTL